MKLFLDTNILLEYLCGRDKAIEVRELLDAIEDNRHCIITFNTKDYKNVEQEVISVLTPSKFLSD